MLKSTSCRCTMIAFLTALCALPPARLAAADLPKEAPAERDARMKWFNEARFGMFIHWGVYSVPAGEVNERITIERSVGNIKFTLPPSAWKAERGLGEWFLEETHMPVSQYEKFAQQFNPVKFDAKKWVAIAKGAGVKYIVITSKHHDGFGMFPSKETNWCIKSTPFKRDPLKELSAACREAGIKFCLYHSIMDWHHPDWGARRAWNDKASGTPDMDRYTAYMKRQLKELVSNYGPLGILWFDGEWESPWTAERGEDLYAYVRSLQPDIIINNRVGKARAGIAGMDKGRGVGDYFTPEQNVPDKGFGPGVYWESCMTMNDHWGYNRDDHNWKSTTQLIHILANCASKGGNLLLNVGPTSEGLIPGPSIERLKEVGEWMKVNGESIYGTTATTIGKPKWGCSTTKSKRTYLHVFEWPKDGKLAMENVPKGMTKAWLLGDSKKQPLPIMWLLGEITVTFANPPHSTEKNPPANKPTGTAYIDVPAEAPDKIDTVIVLE
jgi:alpha-L-fucosidase